MNNVNTILLKLLVLASLCFLTTANANSCGAFKTEQTSLFPKTYQLGKDYGEALCQFHTGDEQSPTFEVLKDLSSAWQASLLKESASLVNMAPILSSFPLVLNDNYLSQSPATQVTVDSRPRGDFVLLKNESQTLRAIFNDSNACKPFYNDNSCRVTLADYASVANLPSEPLDDNKTAEALKKYNLYSQKWQRYYYEARSQTFVEIALNSYLNRKKYRDGKPHNPPSHQWIALHPSIAMHYVDHADDGEQFKEALVIEWVGYNDWDRSLPLGVSLVSLYSDRGSVDDLGHGVMFHIDNDFSIGVTSHDGDMGVFLSVDLLKLFESKHGNYKRTVAKYKELID